MHIQHYEPIIKGKGFCPNPVVRYGVPDHADGSIHPEVIGTAGHSEWWMQEIDRCLSGYVTGGIFIPGRYYYYLNHCYITSIGRGNHKPEFVDLDLEFFNLVEEAKRTFKGLIIIKARRRGLSEKWAKAIGGYGLRFFPEKYKCGIVAASSNYSEELFYKFKESNTMCSPEFRLQHLVDNIEEFKLGWEEKTDSGWTERGSFNTCICRTMKTNMNILKGHMFNDVAYEESGENDNLIPGFNAGKKCFAVGTEMRGTPFVYGTGGNIKSSSKGFSEMWNEAENYHLLKMAIYRDRLSVGFFIGSKNADGEISEDCPNLLESFKGKEYTRDQVLGCEDTRRASEVDDIERVRLKKGKNKEPYWAHLQDNPANEREAFLKFSGNHFDPEVLRNQELSIQELVSYKYNKYYLEYVKDESGVPVTPLRVEAILAPEDASEDDCVLILEHPVLHYKDIDCAGVDSYDMDKSMTSKSLGAMVVLRRFHNLPNYRKMAPVCLIRQRPVRKEIFYDNCLKVAIYYNLVGNVLIDVAKPMIIDYWKRHGGKRFLSGRPKSFESIDSEQVHEYGVALTVRSKPQMLSLIQSTIIDYGDEIWFPQIIMEAQDYDVNEKDSDWDAVDAYGIALMKNADMKRAPIQVGISSDKKDPYDVGVWVTGSSGPVLVSWTDFERMNKKVDPNDKSQGDLFMQMLNSGRLP